MGIRPVGTFRNCPEVPAVVEPADSYSEVVPADNYSAEVAADSCFVVPAGIRPVEEPVPDRYPVQEKKQKRLFVS